MTMFNVLLMVAGVLEYVLLGIDFKVSTISIFSNEITNCLFRETFRTRTWEES